jgi:hypothetical protein
MEAFQEQPRRVEEPSPIRKPSFPRKLFDEDKFINPEAEAQRRIIASEQAIISPQPSFGFSLEQKPKRQESLFASIFDYLLAAISKIKRRFAKNRRAQARLTKLGREALEQLRYLSLLCDACSYRTAEETLAAECAFGEAYYEIMTLSSNLERMSEKECEHHLKAYLKQMSKVLNAAD